MNKLSVAEKSYIAGFLDGDGSIYVRLKPNKTYRFRYQVAPYVIFFQSQKERIVLEHFLHLTGLGYLRDRKDGIVEYTIGDMSSITQLLNAILPYLYLKKQQAKIMLEILQKKKSIANGKDFLELCSLVDQFQKLNYSKRRLHTSKNVRETLHAEGLLTP